MIDADSSVSKNYQRLASDALEDVFDRADGETTIATFRESVLGDIRDSMCRLFPDLILNNLGNPLVEGTFRFNKGSQKQFLYKNLSAGEKAAFDLLLDIMVKRRAFDDTVFMIDEPEAHMNTRLHGDLLTEMMRLINDEGQLWIATHSIGMMRKARQLYEINPESVVFLNFGSHDFDKPAVLEPVVPTRHFWRDVLKIALDDLADLVAPREIVLCEGNPKGQVAGKNEEHDARCYETIFAMEFPDVGFISAGSSKEVAGDRLRFAAAFPKIVPGIRIRRLVDRDDHAPADIVDLNARGIQVLNRRHIESYLYDESIIRALYEQNGRIADFDEASSALKLEKEKSISRENPPDDLKSAAPAMYAYVKRHLGLTACGDDQQSLARNILVPLIKPGTVVYDEMKSVIFPIETRA